MYIAPIENSNTVDTPPPVQVQEVVESVAMNISRSTQRKFLADYLPIGATVSVGDNELNIMSWNVLSKDHLDPWMYELDSQGLMYSMITDIDKDLIRIWKVPE